MDCSRFLGHDYLTVQSVVETDIGTFEKIDTDYLWEKTQLHNSIDKTNFQSGWKRVERMLP